MHRSIRLLCVLLICFLFEACSTAGPLAGRVDPTDSIVHILFVGNSLTVANDLPGLVKQQAKEIGIDVRTRMIAQPNYALIDHLADGLVQQEIADHHYDFVVVQQGPSSQEEGRQMLLDAGRELAELCQSHHARLAYFMVWPSLTNAYTFEGVIRNYTEAATLHQAILCPVGEVWKKHFDATGSKDYYGPDGFHPSLEGSRVAAEVILSSLLEGL
ncbi:MAG: SGNH/GDSL hydrolase family protein [Saprospiraceae bacterium]|nr:SGNH/GDSL hydrolase family protein [Saprospiraceae bacterium]